MEKKSTVVFIVFGFVCGLDAILSLPSLSKFFPVDGQYFQAIETIDAAGYALTPQYYEVTDESAPNATVYYRILQVDMDGTSSLSPLTVVRAQEQFDNEPKVYPNPGVDQIFIEGAKECTLVIQDLKGNELLSTVCSSDRISINTSLLANSFYLLRFVKEDEVQVVRWVKR